MLQRYPWRVVVLVRFFDLARMAALSAGASGATFFGAGCLMMKASSSFRIASTVFSSMSTPSWRRARAASSTAPRLKECRCRSSAVRADGRLRWPSRQAHGGADAVSGGYKRHYDKAATTGVLTWPNENVLDVHKDSAFPFKTGDDVWVTIKDGRLIIEPFKERSRPQT